MCKIWPAQIYIIASIKRSDQPIMINPPLNHCKAVAARSKSKFRQLLFEPQRQFLYTKYKSFGIFLFLLYVSRHASQQPPPKLPSISTFHFTHFYRFSI